MDWDKMAVCFLFVVIMTIIISASLFHSDNIAKQTDIERKILACDYICPHDSEYCKVECIKGVIKLAEEAKKCPETNK